MRTSAAGRGPGGATRLFSILAYEFAIAGLRYSAGVAVAMSVVPALLLLIIILGRYMQGDPDATDERGNLLAQLGALLSWPFAMVLRGLLFVLIAVGDAIEYVLGGGMGILALTYTRGEPERERSWQQLTRRLGNIGAYAALGVLLVFLLFPFYWVIATAFKTDEQMRTSASVFWPSP
jgi:multiple sugar transport system permease protein